MVRAIGMFTSLTRTCLYAYVTGYVINAFLLRERQVFFGSNVYVTTIVSMKTNQRLVTPSVKRYTSVLTVAKADNIMIKSKNFQIFTIHESTFLHCDVEF